jgi:hypothetical protein
MAGRASAERFAEESVVGELGELGELVERTSRAA